MVNPLKSPSVEFACKVAAEPSAGITSVYPSTRDSRGTIASSEMLFTAPVDFNDSVSDERDFAALTTAAEEAPRSTTSACSWSFAMKLIVRAMASVRSEGTFFMPVVEILKPGESFSAVEPVVICRGAGQSANDGEMPSRIANAKGTFDNIVVAGRLRKLKLKWGSGARRRRARVLYRAVALLNLVLRSCASSLIWMFN